MKKSTKFSPEVRERAVRLVLECRNEHPSQWAAVESIAGKSGARPARGRADLQGVADRPVGLQALCGTAAQP